MIIYYISTENRVCIPCILLKRLFISITKGKIYGWTECQNITALKNLKSFVLFIITLIIVICLWKVHFLTTFNNFCTTFQSFQDSDQSVIWLLHYLRVPLNLFAILSRKLFWGAMRPFLAAVSGMTNMFCYNFTAGWDCTTAACKGLTL